MRRLLIFDKDNAEMLKRLILLLLERDINPYSQSQSGVLVVNRPMNLPMAY